MVKRSPGEKQTRRSLLALSGEVTHTDFIALLGEVTHTTDLGMGTAVVASLPMP